MNTESTCRLDTLVQDQAIEILREVGINTCADLLKRGSDANGRAELAQKTRLLPGKIESLVIQADLLQINLVRPGGCAGFWWKTRLQAVAGRLTAPLRRQQTFQAHQPDILTPAQAAVLTAAGIDGLAGLARMTPAGIKAIAQTMAQQQGAGARSEAWQNKLERLSQQAEAACRHEKYQSVLTHSHNYLIASDLHIGQGIEPDDGKINRNEDFLYDNDFADFLVYHQQKREATRGQGTAADRPWRLVINGDFVDFLQVTGMPARNYTELEKKARRYLGEVASPEPDAASCPQSADARMGQLIQWFQPVQQSRRRLTALRKQVEQAIPKSQSTDHLALHTLKAEIDILLAMGDSLLDTNRLTDLEELLRIPAELDTMTLYLNRVRHDNTESQLDLADKESFLQGLHEKLSKRDPLSRTEYTYLRQQILDAWQQLCQAKFTSDFLQLVQDLNSAFPLDPATDLRWIPPNLEKEGFDRYQDVFHRYCHVYNQLGYSTGHLVDDRHAAITNRALRQKFEQLFYKVPQWPVGRTDPYELDYHQVRWGLGSGEAENVWRLYRIFAGHTVFFQAMAWFLAAGNDIVIQTGNHDIELFWPKVREAMRQTLVLAYEQLDSPAWRTRIADFAAGRLPARPPIDDPWRIVRNQLAFTHWLYYEPGVVYIEHGCQYETANSWPTYLDPRLVGTVADHWIRTAAGEVKPGQVAQEKLFWPWGSLIVRYIFNQIEQTHPFADQVKPISRYFTWAFNRDFLRTLGLLILSTPGMGRVLSQFLNRGVVEGWFGTTRSLLGVGNMMLRGASTWAIWMTRFLSFRRMRSAAERRKLRWPVLPWEAWQLVVGQDEKRSRMLADRLPHMVHDPPDIEGVLEEPGPRKEPETPPFWDRILEFIMQVGLVLTVVGLIGWLTGWPIWPDSSIQAGAGALLNPTCQALAGLLPAPAALLGFLPASLPLILVVLFILPGLARGRLGRQPGWERVATAVVALTGLMVIAAVGMILACSVAPYSIAQPGPDLSFTGAPLWLFWLLLLVAVLALPTRAKETERRQALRRLAASQLFRQSNRPHKLEREVFLHRLVSAIMLLLALAVGVFFVTYYGQPLDRAVAPTWLAWLPWLSLLLWLWFAYRWWGSTVLVAFFAVTAALAFLAFILSLLPAVERIDPYGPLLWLGGSFLGLWLLESRENPFSQPGLQGWLGDRLGSEWHWLQPVFFGASTLIVEIGLIVMAMGAVAQFKRLRGQPLSGIWRSFGDSAGGGVIEIVVAAVLLIAIGSSLRGLLGWMQTEDFPRRVRHWQREYLWLFKALLSLGLVGLVAGSLWTVSGGRWLSEPAWGAGAAIVLGALGLLGWLLSSTARRPTVPVALHSPVVPLLFLVGMGLLIWPWMRLVEKLSRETLLGQETHTSAIDLVNPYWLVATIVLLLGLWLAAWPLSIARPKAGDGENAGNVDAAKQHRPEWVKQAAFLTSFRPDGSWRQVLNATSWGFLLLAGMLATAIVARAVVGGSAAPFLAGNSMPLKTNSVEHAMFSLRVERALRLSYAPTASARETSDYLKRLRREDVALAAYLEAIEEEDVAPEIRDELAQNAIQRCHPPDSASQENPNTATNSGDGKCIEMLDEVWSGRLQPGDESVETFYQQLEKSADAADGAIGIVVEQVRQSQPGWWEQATLRVWLYLMGLDGLTVLTDKAEIRPVAAGELDIAAASMERLAQQRAQQMRALWALDRMAKQERLMTRHGQIAAWVTVWLALLGVGGTLLLTTAAQSVQPIRKSLTAAEQIERVVYTARRQQSGFVRRFAGTATTVLSFTFGLGLVVGAYLVVSGLFSGDVSTLLRNGAVITIISWIGRRLMQLIPADLGHGEGYLEQAAGEIQAILDKADTNKKSLYPASYFLFGHDHVPAFAVLPPLDESGAEPRMRQWYVNTGAWVQSHTGEVRFRREDEAHSIFVEIVPGPATTGEGREPQLWRWDRAVGQPNHLPHLIATHPESLSKRLMKTVLRWLGLNADYTWPR